MQKAPERNMDDADNLNIEREVTRHNWKPKKSQKYSQTDVKRVLTDIYNFATSVELLRETNMITPITNNCDQKMIKSLLLKLTFHFKQVE